MLDVIYLDGLVEEYDWHIRKTRTGHCVFERMILIQVPRRASAIILMNIIAVCIGKGKRGNAQQTDL